MYASCTLAVLTLRRKSKIHPEPLRFPRFERAFG
jgi:hypothetical protein